MIEVHLYGKPRRFTDNLDPSRDSITYVATKKGDSIADIVQRVGRPDNEVGYLGLRYPLSGLLKSISSMLLKISAISGSNWVPLCRAISSRAASAFIDLR